MKTNKSDPVIKTKRSLAAHKAWKTIRKNKAKRSLAAYKAWETRRAAKQYS